MSVTELIKSFSWIENQLPMIGKQRKKHLKLVNLLEIEKPKKELKQEEEFQLSFDFMKDYE